MPRPWKKRAAELYESRGPFCDYAAFREWWAGTVEAIGGPDIHYLDDYPSGDHLGSGGSVLVYSALCEAFELAVPAGKEGGG